MDLDFDKLITEGPPQGPADMTFRARLKQQSGHALVKGRQRRLWYRRSGLTCLVLLVAVSAFWSGRVTTRPMQAGRPTGLAQHNQGDNTVLVTRDLVTWLEAARFFRQLGMDERASKAFQLASKLAPSMEHKNQVAGHTPETRFADHSHRERTLSSLLAHYDAHVEKHQDRIVKPLPVVKRRQLSIIAQSIGGKRHDH